MATLKRVSINGTLFYPTSIETNLDSKAEVKEMANGSSRVFHKAFKRIWTLQWNKTTESVLTALQTIRLLTTTFTYIDEFGVSRTALLLPGAFNHTLNADSIGLNGIEYFDITLIIHEA